MLIERPPLFYRLLYPSGVWRIPSKNDCQKKIYLTFDDGPIPELTPWILEILEQYEIKATFFCVGDNVRKYPEIYNAILDHGHRVGNHTFNHIQGIRVSTREYLKNTELASQYIKSDLFRPPYGHMKMLQFWTLRKKYKIIFWDVVTRDYSKYTSPTSILKTLKHYTRDGSIIVFHDSLKSKNILKNILSESIQWLKNEGYKFETIE